MNQALIGSYDFVYTSNERDLDFGNPDLIENPELHVSPNSTSTTVKLWEQKRDRMLTVAKTG